MWKGGHINNRRGDWSDQVSIQGGSYPSRYKTCQHFQKWKELEDRRFWLRNQLLSLNQNQTKCRHSSLHASIVIIEKLLFTREWYLLSRSHFLWNDGRNNSVVVKILKRTDPQNEHDGFLYPLEIQDNISNKIFAGEDVLSESRRSHVQRRIYGFKNR